MNDYALGEVIYWAFTTRAFATGVPTALAGSPTLEIYENDSTSPIVEGASKLVLTQNLNSINGFNLATITATTGNGFEVGKDYHIIVKTGTVGGTSVAGEVVGRFSIGRLNVTKWAATAVTTSATTALPEVDAKSISNDATAADNLELITELARGVTLNTTGGTTGSDADDVVDLVWDELIVGGHNINNSAGKRLRLVSSAISIDGTVNDAGATTTQFIGDSGLSAVDNFYNDMILIFTDGALAGIARPVADYVGASRTFTIDEALPSAPANGVGFAIQSTHIHPVSQIRDAILPAKNVALSNIEFLMVDATDFATPETGLTVSGTRSIDGAAFGAVTGTIAEVANGIYQLDASQADMNGTIITFRFTATGAAATYLTIRTGG